MVNELDNVLEKIWQKNIKEFPFKDYINPDRKSAYFAMPKMLAPFVNEDAKILDFGCGPLDKTIMFKSLTKKLYAYDTLEDIWHTVDNNNKKIKKYAEQSNIHFIEKFDDIEKNEYDVIMLHDVIEHFHVSPRVLLNHLLSCLKNDGLLVLTVPNAGNIRKRFHLLMGKTNYPRFGYFYWYPKKWDGHVREYVKGDLEALTDFLGLTEVKLQTFHIHLDVLSKPLRPIWTSISKLFPNTRDSFYLIAQKPTDWSPRVRPTEEQFDAAFGRQYFSRLLDFNKLDFE